MSARNDEPGNPGDQYEGRAIRDRLRVEGAPGLALELPAVLVDAIAERAASIVLAELARDSGNEWPAWMSVETAARYLDVSAERVRKLIAARAIPYAQEAPGCRVFLSRAALDEWMLSMARRPR